MTSCNFNIVFKRLISWCWSDDAAWGWPGKQCKVIWQAFDSIHDRVLLFNKCDETSVGIQFFREGLCPDLLVWFFCIKCVCADARGCQRQSKLLVVVHACMRERDCYQLVLLNYVQSLITSHVRTATICLNIVEKM